MLQTFRFKTQKKKSNNIYRQVKLALHSFDSKYLPRKAIKIFFRKYKIMATECGNTYSWQKYFWLM